jgi:hypothetical protein
MQHILTLPEADRRPTIEAEIGYIRIPQGITGEALHAIVDLDLDDLIAIEPPRGYGRD